MSAHVVVGTDTPANRIIADMHVLPHCRFGPASITSPSSQVRDGTSALVPLPARHLKPEYPSADGHRGEIAAKRHRKPPP
jgi:hypothetical protein